MREQAQFNLRVVGRQQHVPGFRDETCSNLATKLGPNRNVLQIGVGGRKTPSCCPGLPEGGVYTTAFAVEQQRQRVDVSRFQLRKLAILEHESGNFMRERQVLQDIDRG